MRIYIKGGDNDSDGSSGGNDGDNDCDNGDVIGAKRWQQHPGLVLTPRHWSLKPKAGWSVRFCSYWLNIAV